MVEGVKCVELEDNRYGFSKLQISKWRMSNYFADNKYDGEFSHLTTQQFKHLTKSDLYVLRLIF